MYLYLHKLFETPLFCYVLFTREEASCYNYLIASAASRIVRYQSGTMCQTTANCTFLDNFFFASSLPSLAHISFVSFRIALRLESVAFTRIKSVSVAFR